MTVPNVSLEKFSSFGTLIKWRPFCTQNLTIQEYTLDALLQMLNKIIDNKMESVNQILINLILMSVKCQTDIMSCLYIFLDNYTKQIKDTFVNAFEKNTFSCDLYVATVAKFMKNTNLIRSSMSIISDAFAMDSGKDMFTVMKYCLFYENVVNYQYNDNHLYKNLLERFNDSSVDNIAAVIRSIYNSANWPRHLVGNRCKSRRD